MQNKIEKIELFLMFTILPMIVILALSLVYAIVTGKVDVNAW